MKQLLITFGLLCALSVLHVNCDLLDCDEQKLPSLADVPVIGPKITSAEDMSAEHEVRDFFKNVGCKIKKGAEKVTEQAKKLGSELKEGAIKLGERAKDLGSDLKTRFSDFKEKLSQENSDPTEEIRRGVPANVELINPDILKAEQMCGHGYVLDALGNCSKLRK